MGLTRAETAFRAARELRDGSSVDLGTGLPTLVPEHLPRGVHVVLLAENGVLGVGPHPDEDEVDPDLVDAGEETVTVLPRASSSGSEDSSAMVRGGKFDVALLGAVQVSAGGVLADRVVPGRLVEGAGGAMDLVHGARSVVVLVEHVARDGSPRSSRAAARR